MAFVESLLDKENSTGENGEKGNKEKILLLTQLKEKLQDYVKVMKKKGNSHNHNNIKDEDYFVKRLFSNNDKSILNSEKMQKIFLEEKPQNEVKLGKKFVDFKVHPQQNFKNPLIKDDVHNIIISGLSDHKITDNEHENLLSHIKSLKKSKKIVTATAPFSKCNNNWNYKKHGEDWGCMVHLNKIV